MSNFVQKTGKVVHDERKMQLSVRDVAKLLNVNEKTVYRWVTQGNLPAYRVSNHYRFNRAELLEWATAQRINVSTEIFQEPENPTLTLSGLVAAQTGAAVPSRNPPSKPSSN